MHAALRFGYEGAARLAGVGAELTRLAPDTESKVVRALRARRGIRDRFRAWGKQHRDPSRPLLWMHAPSVGEGLQARPVLELVRRRHPDIQLAYTHFSPSAESFARSLDVDFHDYLPFDTERNARATLEALRPTAIVYSKLDVWPTLTAAAHSLGVRLGLVSATLASASSRRSRLAAALLRDAYAALDRVGAIDPADAERLIGLGVRADAIVVTGDTRYDQVWARARNVDREGALLARLASRCLTIVAGSTWPADEAALLPAFAAVRREVADARLIIAPHEPTAGHLEPIERWAVHEGLQLHRLGEATSESEVVLVDRVGVLGDLYALADVAFVGGGFHDAGLHSVLEPAAFGAPVLVGPRHTMSREAGLLIARGGARSVNDIPTLAHALTRWSTERAARMAAGEHARATVRDGLGAAARSLNVVETLLGLPNDSPR